MESRRSIELDQNVGSLTETPACETADRSSADTRAANAQTARSEWTATALRPIAHWVQMPTTGGRSRLHMVWEVPDPLPLSDSV